MASRTGETVRHHCQDNDDAVSLTKLAAEYITRIQANIFSRPGEGRPRKKVCRARFITCSAHLKDVFATWTSPGSAPNPHEGRVEIGLKITPGLTQKYTKRYQIITPQKWSSKSSNENYWSNKPGSVYSAVRPSKPKQNEWSN